MGKCKYGKQRIAKVTSGGGISVDELINNKRQEMISIQNKVSEIYSKMEPLKDELQTERKELKTLNSDYLMENKWLKKAKLRGDSAESISNYENRVDERKKLLD